MGGLCSLQIVKPEAKNKQDFKKETNLRNSDFKKTEEPDWFDLFAVQGTLKCLFQYHSSKASIVQYSAFLIVQLSYLYMTTGNA